jgi:DNA-binding NarL/FixJ family response regulator
LSLIRILVAEDYSKWRDMIRLLLLMRPEWQVTGEAVDGPEAVQKAEELKPDLVILDVGLPSLNGIEAARQIRRVSPNSKIIFLSQEFSLDVVQAALSTGAVGYVDKASAQGELITAIEAVLRGRQFISSNLRGYTPEHTPEVNGPWRHEARFYTGETFFLDSFTRFLKTALKSGDVAIVLATESHRKSIVQRLRGEGIDVDAAIQQGTLISLDVSNTLSTFMVNDWPDPVRFFERVGGLMEEAIKACKGEHGRIVACGECAPHLLTQGKAEAAIRLEQLWDEVVKTYDLNILCGYMQNSLHQEAHNHIFRRICAEHSVVYSP